MNFIGVHVSCSTNNVELLIAEFSLFPYDTFEEHEHGFSAYCVESSYVEKDVLQIIKRYSTENSQTSFSKEVIPKKNWNQIWESNFDSAEISKDILIRAPFHKSSGRFRYEIVLSPKMAFGTGHHATTTLMLRQISSMHLSDKVVHDIGAGTGVLAILAKMKGAKSILATDVDDWCVENCLENFKINDVDGQVRLGKVNELKLPKCDVLLANINKNILLEELKYYVELVNLDGSLLLSGFYTSDNQDIVEKAEMLGFTYKGSDKLNDWSTLLFHNPTL